METPVSLYLEAQLKGQMVALEQASTAKKCDRLARKSLQRHPIRRQAAGLMMEFRYPARYTWIFVSSDRRRSAREFGVRVEALP